MLCVGVGSVSVLGLGSVSVLGLGSVSELGLGSVSELSFVAACEFPFRTYRSSEKRPFVGKSFTFPKTTVRRKKLYFLKNYRSSEST